MFDFGNVLFYKDKADYNIINSARSALASIVTLDDPIYPIGSHPLVGRYLRRVFHIRPPAPRYMSIWDVSRILTFLGNRHLLTNYR